MSVVGGVSLIAVSIVLGVVGVFTLFIGIGFLVLLLALILFIVGLVLVAQGDSPPYGYHVHSSTMPAYPPAYHGYPTYPPPAPPPAPPVPSPPTAVVAGPAERYCPSCGAGNLRVSAFCHKCGKPLPPPP